jgi:hypothetical protein
LPQRSTANSSVGLVLRAVGGRDVKQVVAAIVDLERLVESLRDVLGRT